MIWRFKCCQSFFILEVFVFASGIGKTADNFLGMDVDSYKNDLLIAWVEKTKKSKSSVKVKVVTVQ